MSTVTVSSGNSPYNVSSGQSDTNDVVVSGGSMLVDSGGTASATTVSSGGSETVNTGGTDLGAQISGGTQVDFGLASGATIDSGGTQIVDSGGSASATTISGGGAQWVGNYDGGLGTATGTTIASGGTQFVGEGLGSGAATSTTILSGGVQDVGANGSGTATDTTISNGGTQYVGVGGSGAAISTTILTGGTQVVGDFGSATATNTTILSGGEQLIGFQFSGTAISTTISSGGTQVVGDLSSGTATSTTILSGGTEIISSGGVDSGARISGGTQLDYGLANGATVFTGSQVVESGGTASGTTISGGTEYVSSGGAALGATFGGTAGTLDLEQPQGLSGTISGWQVGDVIDFVSTSVTSASISGSTLTVTVSGGSAFTYQLAGQEANTGANVQSDGAGGTDVTLVTETPIVSSGQTLKVSSGQTSNGIVVLSGGTVDVLSGGVASGTVVSSGGTEIVSAGGTDDGTKVSGGTQLDYGVASGTTVFTGSQVVESGGTAIGTILSGGAEIVSAGGTLELLGSATASGFTIGSGGTLEVASGYALSGYTVSSGVALEVANGGVASATIISGGTETISSGGTDDGAKISGGTQLDYGLASGATIVTGSQVVEAGGVASATIISGGTETVSSGGTDDGAKISGGTQLDYGLASGATIVTGSEVVEAGGVASATIISGGTETISSGGTDDGAKISGGTQLDYGLASGATIVTGSQVVEAGGVASATIISGGTETVSSGGTDDGAKISGGTQLDYGLASGATIVTGSQVVEAGGVASATIISGGTETVSSGGTDDGAKISGGTQLDYGLASGATIVTGSQVVENGGTASGTTVSSGGTLDVLSGGLADPTTILSGGTEIVSAGGTDDGAKISGGAQLDYGLASGATIVTGSQVVEAGGTASGTIISGGTQLVDAGGSAAATTISGGTFEIASGGSAVGAISFAGTGGSLKIDGTVPSTVISGFAYGDVIDLAAVTFVSSGKVQLMSGNVLEVVEGGSSYNLQLNPSTSFAGEIFELSADGAAGTDVTFGPPPPVETPIQSAVSMTAGEVLSGSSLFNAASVPNGATITEYWVTAGNPSVGQWDLNGQPVSGAVTPAQLSELTFDALTPGSETIYLQATDNGGATWSAWQGNGVAVTVAQSPPVVETPIQSAVSMTAGEVLSGSSLFNAASAPNGATITEYWVTAGNPSVGQWDLNGKPVSGAVTPAQLSELTFDALTPGSETIYLQATDNGGATWSAWQGNGVAVTVAQSPPVVETPIQSAVSMTAGEVLSGSSLFNAASAPNGATVTEYWVTAGNPSVGQWDLNGKPVSGAVTPAQLSELTFDALTPGSETIYLQATDNGGATWSAWQGNGVAVTVAQSPPVVETPIQSAVSMTAGEVLSGSSLFNAASAPNGATITEYWVTAGNPSVGQWDLNGKPVSGAVTPAQLSELTFDALTPGSETIYLQATDNGGATWSAWQGNGVAVTVSTPTLTIANGATEELSSAYTGAVLFAGSTGTLQLDNSSSFAGTVAGLADQDTLDLRDINFASVHTPTYSGNSSGGTLTVTDGTHSANIALLGNYLASSFVTSSDGHGGTNVVDPVLSSANQQLALTQPHHA